MDVVARTVTGPGELVGRDTELAELVSALDLRAHRDGAGTTQSTGAARMPATAVLLAGDAGIGKTRLVEALAEVARDHGWRVFAGHSLDLGESGLPYLPFSEVVARIADDLPEVIAEATSTHPALVRLQPGHRVLGPARPDGDWERLDRGALFEAVRHVLESAAATGPVLVVMEDLHWADQSSRDLLSYLLSRPFGAPVGLVVSYRSDDLHRRHPLRPQIAEWARLRRVHRMQLGPLAPADVRTLIACLHPVPLPAGQAGAIVERAEGNAFFVEELVGAVTEPAGPLPADLADLLLIRLDRLDDVARQVVRVAGVAGRRVPHSLLAAVSGLDSAGLDDALRQAVEMNVLRTDGQHYAFRHALLAEAAYDDLLPGERVRLHARYVEALQDGRGTGTAAELAHHARRALDRDTAMAASIEAAREAMSVGGPTDATRHYEAALELLADTARAAESGLDLSVIVAEAAEALMASGHVVRAAALVADQLGRLPAGAPPQWRARLLSARASALSVIDHEEDPVALSAAAAGLLSEDDGQLRAKVLTTHARILSQAGRGEEAHAVGLEAMTLAERLRLPLLASDALTTISRIAPHDSSPQRRAALAEAVAHAREAGNPTAELRGQYWLGLSYALTGEADHAEKSLRAAMNLGMAAGTPWAPYAFESRWYLGWVLIVAGRWDDALVELEDPDECPPPVPGALLDVQRLQIRLARGEGGPDAAGRLPAMRAMWPGEGLLAIHAAGLEIEAASRAARLADAVGTYDDVVEVMSRVWSPWFEARLRLATTALTAVADAVELVSAAERPDASARADRLLADAQGVLDRVATRGLETAAWADLAHAEHLRFRWLVGEDPPSAADLVAAWTAAVSSFERFGHVYLTARMRAQLAEILTATGDVDGARAAAGQAREVAVRLRATPLVARIDRLAPRRPPVPATARIAEALTPRESEVLALVAEGRSNGEIGKRLFISTKTVSVHVSNILAKLGASGRTEAAALARRRGLLSGGGDPG